MFRFAKNHQLFWLASIFTIITLPAHAADEALATSAGKQVSFFYVLTVDGEVVENNRDQEPLVYVEGKNQILPVLEAELSTLAKDDKKTVVLAAADAYGERNPEAVQEVPIEQIPEDSRVVGMVLQAEGFPGPILIKEVREEVVVLDFNHPLAGKELTFDITITDIVAVN